MCNDAICRPGERLDDLQNNGLQILQKTDGYRFGTDAVLLAHFARLRPRDRVADLGAGTGILPLLMSRAEPTARFFAFERQAGMADMARRSVALNGLEERITVYAADLRDAGEILGSGSMNAVVCNPPYGKRGNAAAGENEARLAACRETDCGPEELARACAAILKNRGRLWMSFPAQRLLELADALRAARLEPKRARLVCAKAGRPPYLALVEAVKNAKPTLVWLPLLTVLDGNGRETEEIRKIYGGGTDAQE